MAFYAQCPDSQKEVKHIINDVTKYNLQKNITYTHSHHNIHYKKKKKNLIKPLMIIDLRVDPVANKKQGNN